MTEGGATASRALRIKIYAVQSLVDFANNSLISISGVIMVECFTVIQWLMIIVNVKAEKQSNCAQAKTRILTVNSGD